MGHRAVKARYGSIKKYKAAQEAAAKRGEILPPLEWQRPKREHWKPRHLGQKD